MKVEANRLIGDYTGMTFDRSLRPNTASEVLMQELRGCMSDFLNGEADVRKFVEQLTAKSRNGQGFQFIFNHQIQRLLISDGSYKITLSGPKDEYEHIRSNGDIKLYPHERKGIINIDHSSVEKARGVLADVIPRKKLVGIQGLASFPSAESRSAAYSLAHNYLSQFNPSEYAVLRSGDMMGSSKIAYIAARELGFETIGIIPKAFKPMLLPQEVAHIFEEGEDWGEGSHLFGGLPEEILFLGGGFWTYLEYKEALRYRTGIRLGIFPGAMYTEEFKDNLPKNWIW